MTVRALAKYSDSSSRTSSGSRDSESEVNPTRSPNSTEVTRRSLTRAVVMSGAGDSVDVGADSARGTPQAPQNRWSVATGAPQEEHSCCSGVPHEPQKRFASGLAVWHAGHCMSLSEPDVLRRAQAVHSLRARCATLSSSGADLPAGLDRDRHAVRNLLADHEADAAVTAAPDLHGSRRRGGGSGARDGDDDQAGSGRSKTNPHVKPPR